MYNWMPSVRKSKIPARKLQILLCLIILFSLWVAVFLSKLLNKNINNIIIESIAMLIGSIFFTLGAIGIASQKNVKCKKNDNKKIESVEGRALSLEEKASCVDVTGAAVCCAMQAITLTSTIIPIFFNKHTTITTVYKIVDLIGVAFFCIATAMILAGRSQKQQVDKSDKEQAQNKRKKISIAAVMLCGMAMNLIGKAIDSFSTGANINLGNNKILNIALLLRIIGITLFIIAFSCEMLQKPRQHLDKTSNNPTIGCGSIISK